MITIQEYLDDNSVDIIADVLTDADGNAYSYATKAGRAIWAMYRYAPMNTCDSDDGIKRWIQRGKDMAYNLDERYAQLFTAYENFKATGDLTSIESKQKQVTATGGTVANTGSVTNTNKDDKVITTTAEAIPQYQKASDGTWLTGRNVSTPNGTVVDTRVDDTAVTTNMTATTDITGISGVIPSELIERMRNGLFNPYLEYAREYRSLFIPFWFDECGCGI